MSVPTVLFVVTIVFGILHLLPGSPALTILGMKATSAEVQLVTKELHLNVPLWQQYVDYLGELLTGHLGQSFIYHKTVLSIISESLPRTFELTLVAVLETTLLGVPFGLLAGYYANTHWDQIITIITTLGVVLPAFVVALIVLYLFSDKLHWVQITGIAYTGTQGFINPLAYAVPGFTLAIGMAAPLVRILRREVQESMQSDWVRTLRVMGVSETRIMWRWLLRNVSIPAMTYMGTQFGLLLGGVVVIENIFAIPGMGNLLVSAIFNKDYPLVQGTILVMAGLVIVVNMVIDLLYAILDPRIVYD